MREPTEWTDHFEEITDLSVNNLKFTIIRVEIIDAERIRKQWLSTVGM